jgi:argininosuccinate lyase
LTAAELGFAGPVRNSLDAVAARDHILELAAAATICAVHLSRIGEELVLWTSAEFGFARLSDAFASSSSIMPQKRNADAAELARAYAGRLLGRFTGFAATLKSLPLAYNKDLQESTLTLLQTGEDLQVALWATAGMIDGMTFDAERMRAAVEDPRGFILATDLADHLVRQGLPFREAHGQGLPFREAHGQVAALVKWCEANGKGLEGLTLEEIRAHCPGAADDVREQALTIEGAINARAHLGGTATAQVEVRLTELEAELGS